MNPEEFNTLSMKNTRGKLTDFLKSAIPHHWYSTERLAQRTMLPFLEAEREIQKMGKEGLLFIDATKKEIPREVFEMLTEEDYTSNHDKKLFQHNRELRGLSP